MSETIGQLKLWSSDGKPYWTDVADQEQLFRLVQSIPSPKVEPIKLWIARVASERIDEMMGAPENHSFISSTYKADWRRIKNNA